MVWRILLLVIIAYLIYAPIPEILFKLLHIRTLYKGPNTTRAIALTFDDGPDPRYTPKVLQILREHGAKATFFLVGRRAAEHPDLVRAILADGHEIASHGHLHRHAWLMTPWSTWRDIREGKRQVERITGQPIRYYRPPWGAFNWFTRIACARLHLQPVLWSVRAIDWLPGEYADDVVKRVIQGAHTGAIVLCHDAGGAEGAPRNTIAALPEILTTLGQRRFTFTTVGALAEARREQATAVQSLYSHYPTARRALIRLWTIVEFAFRTLYRIEPVNRIFRVSPTVWTHGTRTDANGEVIVQDGDAALELHFQNETLITISGARDNRALIRGLRGAKEGFRDIAQLLRHDPRYQNVRAIVAPTLMNRGVDLLGFHIEELPDNRGNRWVQGYMRFLLGLYHPDGFARLKEGRQSLEMKLIWMSREEVLNLYGRDD
ncbi:polysaccharide deacetylase familiy protein [Alicyclobacillus contaminans]|uniref:polysaccharide deacetylase family protein n=1 Tax=Alicyclobacillus contaminans TaxID=392016 RepID=UPI00041EAF39|nr:polysaccharide deacetylase family protein [Alicyclobacillus contaminans]GMA50921.1 polysaccharide deacetylase familiy protein [Alicyclobacillus contaminans]